MSARTRRDKNILCVFVFRFFVCVLRHSTTYRAETTLNYGMERVWALAASPDNNKVRGAAAWSTSRALPYPNPNPLTLTLILERYPTLPHYPNPRPLLFSVPFCIHPGAPSPPRMPHP